jgi:hypothetical protein
MASMVSDADAPDPKSPLGVEVVMTQDGDRSSHRVVWYLHCRQDLIEEFYTQTCCATQIRVSDPEMSTKISTTARDLHQSEVPENLVVVKKIWSKIWPRKEEL